MKKLLAAMLVLVFVLAPVSAFAAISFALNLSAKEVKRGGEITISGTAPSDENDVAIKIVTPNQTVFYIDSLSPANGLFQATVSIPTDEDLAPFGDYKVIAGVGSSADSKTFSVVENLHDGTGNNGNNDTIDGSLPTGNQNIPPNAGQADGSSARPESTADGRLIIGSDTLAKVIAQASDSITINLPTPASDSGNALEFPASVLKDLKEKQLNLILSSGDTVIRYPAGFLTASDPNDKQARVRILLNSSYTDTAKNMVDSSIRNLPDYASTKSVLSVEIQLISSSGSIIDIHKLEQPAEVTMKLTKDQQQAISSDLAGVYYVNGDTPEYVGGVIANGTLTFTATHFSYYAILDYNKTFVDTTEHWAEQSIKSLAAKHIVSGVDDRHYEPNRSITRAEFVTLLMRAIDWKGNAEVKAAANTFKDVAVSQYYSEPVNRAASLGIISGYNGAFRPNDRITREEAVVAMMRSDHFFKLAVSSKDEIHFSDRSEISTWASEAVSQASSLGLVEGNANRFNPKRSVTRAEVAVMINRLLLTSSL